MNVSIIIPSLESPLIGRIVGQLQAQQTRQAMEILVVGKDSRGLVPRVPRVRFIDTGKPVPAGAARNLGIESSTGDLLIFLDSDCLPEPGWLDEHLGAHAQGHPVVGGGVRPARSGYWSLVYNMSMFHEFLHSQHAGPRTFLPTLNLSVERSVIEAVGPQREDLLRCQDMEWTARMRSEGYSLMFWPGATVVHEHHRTSFRSAWSTSAGSGRFSRKLRAEGAFGLSSSSLTAHLLRRPGALLSLSPIIASAQVGRIIASEGANWLPYVHTVPGVWLMKVAWCVGAAASRSEEVREG